MKFYCISSGWVDGTSHIEAGEIYNIIEKTKEGDIWILVDNLGVCIDKNDIFKYGYIK